MKLIEKGSRLSGLFIFIYLVFIGGAQVGYCNDKPEIKGILFYKPRCKECNRVIREFLPKMESQYGDKLTIITANNGNPKGGMLYLNTLMDLNVDLNKQLPLLIIGDQQLSGASEIIIHLPVIIEKELNQGIQWPAITGLNELLEDIKKMSGSEQQKWMVFGPPHPVMVIINNALESFNRDSVGNTYAVLILGGMLLCLLIAGLTINTYLQDGTKPRFKLIVPILFVLGVVITEHLANMQAILELGELSLGLREETLALILLIVMVVGLFYSIYVLVKNSADSFNVWQKWIIPLLLIAGFVTSGYLTYIEFNQIEAVCGAIGDCNAVQESPFSKLFGLIPVALLGLLGNLAVLVTWFLSYYGPQSLKDLSNVALFLILFTGTLFFVYLTFLEPFVIGATCFWCISGATAMTIQLYASTKPAGLAYNRLRVG